LNNESNPNFKEKTFLINKIKYIVKKYGNIFLKGLTNNNLPVYKKNNQEIHFVKNLISQKRSLKGLTYLN
jgi:hypothetical protein